MNKNIQMSESLVTGMLLAFTGGFLDAYTYITRGGVFANAQTGNMVLFGIKIFEGDWYSLSYLIPIFTFIIGIASAEAVKRKYKNSPRLHWRQIIIIAEILVLLICSFVPKNYNLIVNSAISFVCSLQVAAFRKVNGNPYATTMCTGNLRSAIENLMNYKMQKDNHSLYNSLQYFSVIFIFIAGAGTGAVLSNIYNVKAVLFTLIPLSISVLLMFFKTKAVKNRTKKIIY